MAKNTNIPWQQPASIFALSGGLALVLFGLIASLVLFVGSFLIIFAGFKDAILGLNLNLKTGILSAITFIMICICLYICENRVEKLLPKIASAWPKNLIFLFSLFVGLLLVGIFYLGFSAFLTFINNSFWI